MKQLEWNLYMLGTENIDYRMEGGEHIALIPPEDMLGKLDRDQLLRLNRANLDTTDYLAIKFAEGELSEEEYAPIREQRRQWRAEINRLESMMDESQSVQTY